MCILMNVYINDVFVAGTTEAEHIPNVEEIADSWNEAEERRMYVFNTGGQVPRT